MIQRHWHLNSNSPKILITWKWSKFPIFLQALSIAHTDQIQQEKELKDAADREIRSVQQNLLNLNQQVLAIQQSKKSLQHLIILKEKEIQQLQTELSDNCELVEELVDQLGELENDNLLIQQFSEQDSSEIEVSLGI